MKKFEYYVLHSDGTRTNTRPEGIDTAYDAYTALSADPGMILQHKRSKKRTCEVVVLSAFVNLWVEVEDK